MTIGGVSCNAQVLLNELTCRIPKGLVIPRAGLPVKVRKSAMNYQNQHKSLKKTQNLICKSSVLLMKVSVNGDVYDMGTVMNEESSNTTVIVGIVMGIIAALVVGAGLTLIVMNHLRKKRMGEKILLFLQMIMTYH